jgi:hypothetical protein
VTLAVLERRADWGQLWALARTAPPCWSAEILRRLGRAGWAPAGPDRADYDSLRQRSSGWDDLALGPPGYCWARLCGHSAPVECLAVSPDGRLLASGDREGRARLWALPGGELLRELPSLPGPVHCLLFGPDGRTLFAGGASAVHYWRLPRGHAGRPFHGCTGPVTALALTPDGKTLVSLSADFAQVWDLTEEEPEGKPLEHGGRLTCLAISPDGEVLATGNTAGDVWLSWHLPDGELKDQLTGHLGPVTGVAFSADGKTVAGAGPAGLLLYDVSSRAARAGPSRHTAPLAAPGFEPDPRALLGRRRAQWAALWPMPDGRALAARCHGRDIRLWTTSRSKNGTTNHTNNTNRRLRCVLAPLREALLFCHSEG